MCRLRPEPFQQRRFRFFCLNILIIYYVRDFELPALGIPDLLDDAVNRVEHVRAVKMEARDRIITLGGFWFSFDGEALAISIELGHTKAIRVGYFLVEEVALVFCIGLETLYFPGKAILENIASQDDRDILSLDNFPREIKRLCNAARSFLVQVVETRPKF